MLVELQQTLNFDLERAVKHRFLILVLSYSFSGVFKSEVIGVISRVWPPDHRLVRELGNVIHAANKSERKCHAKVNTIQRNVFMRYSSYRQAEKVGGSCLVIQGDCSLIKPRLYGGGP